MILEEQRFLHEDLERLEQGIADRVAEDPKQVRIEAICLSSVNHSNLLSRFEND